MNLYYLQRVPIPVVQTQYNINNFQPLNNQALLNNQNLLNAYHNSLLLNNQPIAPIPSLKLQSSYNTLTFNKPNNSITNYINNSNTIKQAFKPVKKVRQIKRGRTSSSGSLLKSSRESKYNRVIKFGKKIRNIDANTDPEDVLNIDTESITEINKSNHTSVNSNITSTSLGESYTYNGYNNPLIQQPNKVEAGEMNFVQKFFYKIMNKFSGDENNVPNSNSIVVNNQDIPLDSDEVLN